MRHHFHLRAVGRCVGHVERRFETGLQGQRFSAQGVGEGTEVLQDARLPNHRVEAARAVVVEPGRGEARLGGQAIGQQAGRLRLAQPVRQDSMRQKPAGEEGRLRHMLAVGLFAGAGKHEPEASGAGRLS